MREKVKRLKFERIDPAGNYAAISYKAIDGGMMNIKLNPIEADIIEIADSNNNVKMQFCIGEPASEESIEQNISNLDSIPEIKSFLDCLHLNTIKDKKKKKKKKKKNCGITLCHGFCRVLICPLAVAYWNMRSCQICFCMS